MYIGAWNSMQIVYSGQETIAREKLYIYEIKCAHNYGNGMQR